MGGVTFIANDPQVPTAGLFGGVSANNLLVAHSPYNDNMPRSFAFRRTGSSLDLRVLGVVAANATQNGNVDVSAPGLAVDIGASGLGNAFYLNGDIAEMVAVKGPTSGQDLATLEAYFKAKYNL
jgi:hypothetical protein